MRETAGLGSACLCVEANGGRRNGGVEDGSNVQAVLLLLW